MAERGWAVLEAGADPRLLRLRGGLAAASAASCSAASRSSRASSVLGLRLEARLAGLQNEIERARAAGDEDAAQAAHARYIELGTTYARRFVAQLSA